MLLSDGPSAFCVCLCSSILVRKAEKLDPGFKSQLFLFQAVGSAASSFTSLTSVSFIAGLLAELNKKTTQVPNKGIFSLFLLYFFFLIPFVSLIEEKCTEPLRHQTVGARNRKESWSLLSRKQDFSPSLSRHTPNSGLCLHVPSLSFRKWGTPKSSGWVGDTVNHTCAFRSGSSSAFCWEPGSGAAKPGTRKSLLPLLFSISPSPSR